MPLHKSISDVDFPTSVLIWHIATDMLYFQDNNTNGTNSCQQTIKMGRELSNYVMYLVFKCGVMITNTTELQHNHALDVMEAKRSLGEKRAISGGASEKILGGPRQSTKIAILNQINSSLINLPMVPKLQFVNNNRLIIHATKL
jgi:hypothetical protein